MFLFKASRYLQELKTHRPDIAHLRSGCWHCVSRSNFIRVDTEAFTACLMIQLTMRSWKELTMR